MLKKKVHKKINLIFLLPKLIKIYVPPINQQISKSYLILIQQSNNAITLI